jgi:hypothetical protein
MSELSASDIAQATQVLQTFMEAGIGVFTRAETFLAAATEFT